MRARTLPIIGALVLAVGLSGAAVVADDYEVKFVLPSAAQLINGSPVWIKGREVGEVSDLSVEDGKAIVTASVSDDHAPLHEGTTTRVEWKTALGERVVTIYPGPAKHAELPSGALYEAKSTQIEVDQVFAALDKPTRQRIKSLLAGLRDTTAGREQEMKKSIRTAGPTVQALGEVLAAVGRDGPAIRRLVTEMHQLIGPLAKRQDEVAEVVDDLTEFTGTMAAKHRDLRDGLAELPPTLDTVRKTLDKLPPASDAATHLLDDLRPAMNRLPSVARNLSPVLTDLRPTVARLRPTLVAMAELLRFTPGFMDTTHDTVPPAGRLMDRAGPAVKFLRPYTPELVGWFHNWGQNFAGYDSQGHVWGVGLAQAGPLSFHEQTGEAPPVMKVDREPAPGSAVGQPWTDANGSRMR